MKRHRLALAGCVVLLLATRALQASAQVGVSDDFSGTELKSWWVPLGNCVAPYVEAGEAVLSGPAGCSQNSSDLFLDENRYRVGGDFDVSVDLRLVSFSPTSAVQALVAGIDVFRVTGGDYAVVERYYTASAASCAPALANYKGWFQTSNNCDESVHWAEASASSGAFRITRVGSTVTEYYSQGAGWTMLNSTTLPPDSVELALYAGCTGGSGVAYDLRLDNFQLLADYITAVPEPGFRASGIRLSAPSPNPARGSSTIVYSIGQRTLVRSEIIDIAGRVVRVLEEGSQQEPGEHRLSWNGRDRLGQAVQGGVYFARVTAGSSVDTRPVIRLR